MTERDILLLCLREIEQKLNWGSSQQWTNNEYIKLSNLILESTKLSVSTSSLRRLYSMLTDETISFNPQSETRNALARFLGFVGWADFTNANKKILSKEKIPCKKKNNLFKIFLSSVILIIITLAVLFLIPAKEKKYNPELIQMEGKHLVGYDLPHTVVVNYNVSAYPNEIFYINFRDINPENGDHSQSVKLTELKGTLSFTYTHKSNYHIILHDDKNKTLKMLTVCIKTNGWEGYIYQNWPAHFFDSTHIFKDGLMQLNKHNITDNSLNSNNGYRVFFRNNGNFNLSCDSMELTTRLKGSVRKELVECSHIQLELFGDSSRIFLTFMKKGCEGSIKNIEIAGNRFSGKSNDLSGFTFDIGSWNDIKIVVKDFTFSFFVNNIKSCQYEYKKQIGALNGIRLEFKGDGAVDYFYLQSTSANKGSYVFNF